MTGKVVRLSNEMWKFLVKISVMTGKSIARIDPEDVIMFYQKKKRRKKK